MGSEEVLSVRAGLHPRAKRRGQDRVNLRQSSRNFSHGGRGGGSIGWPAAVQGGQRSAPSRGSPKHQKSKSHGSGVQPRNKHSDQQHQRSVSAIVTTVAGSRTGGCGGGIGGGGSSIGVGGMPGGDGSVGHAVHAAAVESVEVFLGDFVPKVAQPPAVATLLSACAEEKGAGGGGGGAAVKKLSKWAAIGRGGKISARATAVCIEEVRERLCCLYSRVALQQRAGSANGRFKWATWFSSCGGKTLSQTLVIEHRQNIVQCSSWGVAPAGSGCLHPLLAFPSSGCTHHPLVRGPLGCARKAGKR